MPASYRVFTTASSAVVPHLDDGVAVSGTNTYYSTVVSLQRATGCSVHLKWTGTPTGALTHWMSNKDQPDETSDTDWVQYTDGFTDPAGGASSTADELGNFRAGYYRVKYVNASGSGTLYGYVNVSRI